MFVIQLEINCCDDVCRGFDHGVDKVLLPVSEREPDINNGSLQSDSGKRLQWGKFLKLLLSDLVFECGCFYRKVAVC